VIDLCTRDVVGYSMAEHFEVVVDDNTRDAGHQGSRPPKRANFPPKRANLLSERTS
jgi:hypothetical protein